MHPQSLPIVFPQGRIILDFWTRKQKLGNFQWVAVAVLKLGSPGLQCWGSFPEATSAPEQVLRGPRTGPRWSRLDAMGGKHGRIPRASWGGVEHQAQADSLMGGEELREGASGCV